MKEDVWKFYYECSMLGKEIPLNGSGNAKENHTEPSNAYYLPYLSAIQLFAPESRSFCSDGSDMYVCDVDGWPHLMKMQYEQVRPYFV